MTIHTPTTEAEVAAVVRAARAAGTPLAVAGGGTRMAGRPVQAAATLSTRALSGITLYEPSEMVIGAWAGTPLATVVETLAEKGQILPFEPMDARPLSGASGEPTVGGLVAANVSGPRRIFAGACRDSLIGVRFVNGDGEIIKNGGRVMKNVTGLDLVKLQAGAFGTLGVLTEVIFKVQPKSPAGATLALSGLSPAEGIAALATGLGSPFEVTGAAFLPAGVGEPRSRTLLRIEGFDDQIGYRLRELGRLLPADAAVERLPGEAAGALWRTVRDAGLLAEPRDHAVWRVSLPPGEAAGFVGRLGRERPFRWFADWGGGLVWLATAEADDAGAAAIRRETARLKGHATLVRGSEDLRARIDVFEPLPPAVMRLQAGLKAGFDKTGILNPGRMYAGV
jgi:glycolate oxidase FAD binding subunit